MGRVEEARLGRGSWTSVASVKLSVVMGQSSSEICATLFSDFQAVLELEAGNRQAKSEIATLEKVSLPYYGTLMCRDNKH